MTAGTRRKGAGLLDAALQLTLPLFGAGPAPTVVRRGMRVIRLGDGFVEYELRRSTRRTIGLSVGELGLTVTAPHWVEQAKVDQVLVERADWIQRKLADSRARVARRASQGPRWEHGSRLYFLGEALTLQVEHARRATVRRDGALLRIALPDGSDAPRTEQIRGRTQGWLKVQAREVFDARLAHFAARLGTGPRRWMLSSARTRWGSCSADRSIRLNWRLVHFPPTIVDYVVCHELAHLREMNHGPRFWATVGSVFPDYDDARAWLRANAAEYGGQD